MAAPVYRPLLRDPNVLIPPVAIVVLVFALLAHPEGPLLVIPALFLGATVLNAVHHAEVVAHKVGEPFGSLVLAVAVTVIEVGLIVTLMLGGGDGTSTLARDTVFAAVMITTNGIVGLSLLLAARRHGTAIFNAEGAGAALATVGTLSVLCLVFPTFTTSRSGPEYSGAQLVFAAVASLVLYLAFVVTQTVRHRDFFLPSERTTDRHAAGDGPDGPDGAEDPEEHADPPSNRRALISLGLLLVSLVAVVGLAKVESPAIESGVAELGFPQAFVGVVIALLVLLPETIAAGRAALRDRTQISLNLGLGSAMASIGLTVPTLAVATIWLDTPLELGLGSTQIVLLVITLIVATLTVVPGRATRLTGVVHLVLMAAFLFLSIQP